MKALPFFAALAVLSTSLFAADTLLLEAESFKDSGGWVLDTQFIQLMGSPYLMAHGMGKPVKDAATTVKAPSAGQYHVWVRTKDWVARWKAPGTPGKFQIMVGGKALEKTFGTEGADWHWQDGGTVDLPAGETAVTLHDLTGFAGRCDAIVFTKDATPPPNDEKLTAWRMKTLGLPEKPQDAGNFDLVVCGGGYGGMGAAISGARMGLKVALIQDRPVLGGNGSSEVRVWAMGGTRRGLFPQLGEIVDEFADKAKMSPGTYEEFGDEKKEQVVRGEKNISLFLNNHIIATEKADEAHLAAVVALDTKTSERRRFSGKFFVDSTGHATIGFMAGAELTTKETGHMGMSNMWRWNTAEAASTFPNVDWALPLEMDDFPYPTRNHAQWFWESGFNIHPIYGLEETRDWNFRAIYGAWNAIKNKGGKAEHEKARLEWVAYVGGTRESRQLLGDVVLTREDIIEKKPFPDGTVPTTWDIDLHYPKEQYLKNPVSAENPFISKAVMDKHVDRSVGYPVPYRCLYSKNIENLFMAGRDVSVTHEALGTVRVMKTGGMMGEVVGKAASICVKNQATPRGVYERYLPELLELLKQPGQARREKLDGPIVLPANYKPMAPPVVSKEIGQMGIKPTDLPGLIIDDEQAKYTGSWTVGSGLEGYVGTGYHYRSAKGEGTARYEFTIPKAGKYEVRLANSPHDNRSTKAPVVIEAADGKHDAVVNLKVEPKLKNFNPVGTFSFAPGKPAMVTIGGGPSDGNIHADAVQLLPVP